MSRCWLTSRLQKLEVVSLESVTPQLRLFYFIMVMVVLRDDVVGDMWWWWCYMVLVVIFGHGVDGDGSAIWWSWWYTLMVMVVRCFGWWCVMMVVLHGTGADIWLWCWYVLVLRCFGWWYVMMVVPHDTGGDMVTNWYFLVQMKYLYHIQKQTSIAELMEWQHVQYPLDNIDNEVVST